jgi:hypothetical protein
LALMRLFHILQSLSSLCVISNHIIESHSKEVATDKNHCDRHSTQVANSHEKEEDSLLPGTRRADVEGCQTSQRHCRYTDEEAVDECNGSRIGGIEYGGEDERGECKDGDMHSLKERVRVKY